LSNIPFDFDEDEDMKIVPEHGKAEAAEAPETPEIPAGEGTSGDVAFTDVDIDDVDSFEGDPDIDAQISNAEDIAADAEDAAGEIDAEAGDALDEAASHHIIEDDGAGLFEGLDDLDDDDAHDDYEIEAVQVDDIPPEPQPKVGGSKRTKTQTPAAAAGRHAMTTSRGVVYVESYNDEEYEEVPPVKKRVAGIAIAAVAVLALVVIAVSLVNYCKRLVSTDTVYQGITLNGNSVGGLTREGLQDYVKTTYSDPISGSSVTVNLGDESYVYSLDKLINLPDVDKLADEMFSYARTGNLFSRAIQVLKLRESGRDYQLDYTVNSETIDQIVALSEKENQAKIEPTYTVEENQIVFTYGRNGMSVDAEGVEATLKEYTDGLVTKLDSGDRSSLNGSVTITPKEVTFHQILKANILNELSGEAQDARIEKKTDTEVRIISEVEGFTFDEEELDAILDRVNSGTGTGEESEVLPFFKKTIINTREFYERVLFRDRLSDASNINQAEDDPEADNKEERDTNITLAVEKLDGYILLSGESLSLLKLLNINDIHTEYIVACENYSGMEAGYIGGGISQVATALYNAALMANITATSRSSYTYAPNFGLMGFDAYVNAATNVDLVITNTDAMPVRINASYANDRITVSITGTVFRPSDFADLDLEEEVKEELITYDVVTDVTTRKLSVQVARSDKPVARSLFDPSRPEGTSEIVQSGITGYTLNLYIIETTGANQEKKFIGVGSYSSRDEVTAVGTGAADPTEVPTDEPTETPTDEPTGEPTDEPTETPFDPTPTSGGEPTDEPTSVPTDEPTDEPTSEPTEEPTAEPTDEPTAEPTEEPTAEPTEEPTEEPTPSPTPNPNDTERDV